MWERAHLKSYLRTVVQNPPAVISGVRDGIASTRPTAANRCKRLKSYLRPVVRGIAT
jgi:hypothetical protein